MGITGSINLMALNNAFIEQRKDKNGNTVDCAVIPLKHNWMHKTEKGNVYMRISAREINQDNKREDSKDTHIVSLSVDKETYDKLRSIDKYPPTLGNLTDWDKVYGSGANQASASPQQSTLAPPDADDVPF